MKSRAAIGPEEAEGRCVGADAAARTGQAAENLLRAPAEVLDLVSKKLTALKRQRQHVHDELRAAEAATKPTRDVEAEVDACVAGLWRLGKDLAASDPARRREVFRAFVDRDRATV